MKHLFVFAICLLSLACNKKGSEDPASSSCAPAAIGAASASFTATAGVFSSAPMSSVNYSSIFSLGYIHPSTHPVPSDHMLFALTNTSADAAPVYAPASGDVYLVEDMGGGDYRVTVRVDPSFLYFFEHIHLASATQLGSEVVAGQTLGTNSGASNYVHFGVINHNQTATDFINTCRWNSSLHKESPLKYFTGALATVLYNKVNRNGSDKDGRADQDTTGTLKGNWAKLGLAETDTSTLGQKMSFVYDVVDPTQMRISLGDSFELTGVFAVHSGATGFASVNTSSGKLTYQLYFVSAVGASPSATQSGLLLVELLSDSRIKVEVIVTSSLLTAEFDDDAQIWVR